MIVFSSDILSEMEERFKEAPLETDALYVAVGFLTEPFQHLGLLYSDHFSQKKEVLSALSRDGWKNLQELDPIHFLFLKPKSFYWLATKS
ncbi:MAG TPA: hypothetical protein VJB99_04280 [Patescibacteria group bacterium]|nr:hypothetical protein [Patescibacteria group bacterium]